MVINGSKLENYVVRRTLAPKKGSVQFLQFGRVRDQALHDGPRTVVASPGQKGAGIARVGINLALNVRERGAISEVGEIGFVTCPQVSWVEQWFCRSKKVADAESLQQVRRQAFLEVPAKRRSGKQASHDCRQESAG